MLKRPLVCNIGEKKKKKRYGVATSTHNEQYNKQNRQIVVRIFSASLLSYTDTTNEEHQNRVFTASFSLDKFLPEIQTNFFSRKSHCLFCSQKWISRSLQNQRHLCRVSRDTNFGAEWPVILQANNIAWISFRNSSNKKETVKLDFDTLRSLCLYNNNQRYSFQNRSMQIFIG